MKKELISVLALSALCLSACGNTSAAPEGTSSAEVTVTMAAEEETTTETTAAEAESDTPTDEPEEEGYSLPSDLPKKKLIIDTDTAADDASAIILAAKSGSAEILGVTTLAGNVTIEQSTQNALMALETAGCDAPVYKGAENRYNGDKIEAFSVFGADGMGDADLIHPTGKAEEQDAVEFILDTVKQNPNEVELVALGPATNIANAIKKDPETMKQVKMIWSMGTAGLGPGNASPVAEFNVYSDAEAYKAMLDLGIPVTVIGLDCCDGEAQLTDPQRAELAESGDIGSFVSASFEKLKELYSENCEDSVMDCDAVAMSCVLNPDFVKSSVQAHGSCITDEGECFAQVIFYREGFNYDLTANDFDYNVTLITDVDKGHFFDMYKAIITK